MKILHILNNTRYVDALALMPITIFTFIFASKFFEIAYNIDTFVKISIVMLLYLFYALSINNYFDWKNDKINEEKIKKNPIAAGKLTKKEGLIMSNFLFVFCILLGFLWFLEMLPVYILFLVNAFLYSYKFKQMPILDLVSHSFYVAALFLFPSIILGFSYFIILIGFLLIFFISTTIQLQNEIVDYIPDKKSLVETTAVKYGVRLTKKLYYISNIICISSIVILSIELKNQMVLVFMPLVILAMLRFDVRVIKANIDKIFFPYILFSISLIFFF